MPEERSHRQRASSGAVPRLPQKRRRMQWASSSQQLGTGQGGTARDSRRCSAAGQLLAKTLRIWSEHGGSRSSPCSFGQRRRQWERCSWRNHKQLSSWRQVAEQQPCGLEKAGSQISGLVVDKFRRNIPEKARAHGRLLQGQSERAMHKRTAEEYAPLVQFLGRKRQGVPT